MPPVEEKLYGIPKRRKRMPVKTNQPLANETARGDGGFLSVVSLFMLIHPNIAVKTSSCYIYQVNSSYFD